MKIDCDKIVAMYRAWWTQSLKWGVSEVTALATGNDIRSMIMQSVNRADIFSLRVKTLKFEIDICEKLIL